MTLPITHTDSKGRTWTLDDDTNVWRCGRLYAGLTYLGWRVWRLDGLGGPDFYLHLADAMDEAEVPDDDD